MSRKQHRSSIKLLHGRKKKVCRNCFLVIRRGKLFRCCKMHPKHKSRQL